MLFHPHPLFYTALGVIAGTLAPLPGPSPWLTAALGIAALLAGGAIVRPGRVPLAALIAAAAAAGAGLASEARRVYDQGTLPELIASAPGPVVLEGKLITDPRVVDDEMRFEVTAASITVQGTRVEYRGRVRVFVRTFSASSNGLARPLTKGDSIRAWVDIRRPEPVRTPGGFDQLGWAMREGIHAFATCKNERLLNITTRPIPPRAWMDTGRDRLSRAWRHIADPLNRAVTASMVIGDEGALDVTTREEFRAAGLLHLLVVSGSQVAALIMGLRRAMPPPLRIRWAGCAVEVAVLLAYCLLAGAGDSIVRATIMALAFSVAVRADLHRGGANFLFASAIALLALRPLDALDPGAQMSFAAALALVAFAGAAARDLAARGVPGALADVMAATVVASLAVAPLTLLHFHRLSIIALPANLLAAPLAVALLYASLATVALDVSFPPLAPAAGWICGIIAEALRSLAHNAAASDPDWRGPAPPLALLLGLTGLVAGRKWGRRVLPLAGLLASLSLSTLPRGDGRLHLWFLDVGQGDSVVIETPAGRAAVIDAGPSFETFDSGERVVGEALWRLGHRRLAFLGVTHRHNDHEGGAPFLARHFDPERVYVNGQSETLRDFNPAIVRRGDAWILDGVAFRVLGPDPQWTLPKGDENARSLVVEVSWGATSFLLMGDASRLTEGLLDLPGRRYDLVKVGHHGAATSSSDRLVSDAGPRLAVISAGRRNRFAHPAADVVARWARAGALVWRTDIHRTLHVASDGRHLTWP